MQYNNKIGRINMGNNKNCCELECAYYKYPLVWKNGMCDNEPYCIKQNCEIPNETICDNYKQATVCLNCKYANLDILETGEIDALDYHCSLQNNKLIYSDISLTCVDYADFPCCPINMWEHE